jgi:hypothetical protein
MNFFWFERTNNFNIKELSEELEDNGFSGVLFTYSFFNDDYFVKIANAIDSNKKIKYMVAIRPYAISAQYLCMINNAFKKISKDRIVINIITGWVHDQEKSIGGIQGNVNDLSNNIDRSNYLIEYVKSLKNVKSSIPEFYVSVTNEILFKNVCNNKVIVPYSLYKQNRFDLDGEKTMISVFPIIVKDEQELLSLKKEKIEQDAEYFTIETFEKFLNELESKKITNVLVGNDSPELSKKNILSFVSDFTNKKINILGGKK